MGKNGSAAQPVALIEDQYLSNINGYADSVQAGDMGGDTEMYFMAQLLSCTIHVWIENGMQIINCHNHPRQTIPEHPAANILYNGVNHYDIYVPP